MRRQVPHYRHLVLAEATLAANKTTEKKRTQGSPIHKSSNPAPIETRPLTLVWSSSHSADTLDDRSHKRQVAGSHSSLSSDKEAEKRKHSLDNLVITRNY